jgi:hypothetical protein
MAPDANLVSAREIAARAGVRAGDLDDALRVYNALVEVNA